METFIPALNIKSPGIVAVLVLTLNSIACSASLPKLILISMDGFGYNYLDLIPANETEHFQYMMRNGVKAKAVMNVFPTVTYPNHYTMITGLYPESHGIVHNRFYDSAWKEYFHYNSRRDNVDPFWYDVGAEPIYVANKKAGGSTGSIVWPAGIGEVKGIGPDRLIPGADCWAEIDNIERVDTLIDWFTDKKNPINVGLLYFLEPDALGHSTGAFSKNVTDHIKGELNDILGYLFKKLKEVNLFDDMNIILTSDHGMVNYTKAIVLNEHLNSSWYKTGVKDFERDGERLVLNIFPEEGQEENVLRALRGIQKLRVYTKGDSDLTELHYSSSNRIGPIVITGEAGVLIFPDKAAKDREKVVGVHSYDPRHVPDMRPFFIAMGPAFKKDFVTEHLDLVDIYPLMCHILGVVPAPNNGSFENVKDLLREEIITEESSLTESILGVIVGLGAIVAMAYLIYTLYTCWTTRNKQTPLTGEDNAASGDTRF